jgi:hypothetical protein
MHRLEEEENFREVEEICTSSRSTKQAFDTIHIYERLTHTALGKSSTGEPLSKLTST